MLERLGETPVGHDGVRAAEGQHPELGAIEREQLRGRRGRQQEQRGRDVQQQEHLPGGELREQLFLCDPVDSPRQRGGDHERDTKPELRADCEGLTQAVVEEKPEAAEQHREARPLQRHETFAEEQQPAEEQEHRRELNQDLRNRRAREVERDEVQDIIREEPRNGNQVEPPATARERDRQRQAPPPGEVEPEQAAGNREAEPGDGPRIHADQHDLE